MKRLLNSPERITHERLREVCARHFAEVHAKVRVADVLPIEGSGLPDALYEFALQAHFDFVVTEREHLPLFALEFDGPQHRHSPQAERDAKKDELSRRFCLPLMRVEADDLCRTEWRLDRLTELIERWFADHTELEMEDTNMQDLPKCPVCGSEMVRKRGKYGPFLSCVRYPDCTGSCDLPEPPASTPTPSRRSSLIPVSMCAVVVVALGLLFHYTTQQEDGQQSPMGNTTRGVVGTRSAMTLQEKRAYVSALKKSDFPACPVCENQMVLRNNAKTGDPFFGCSEFPRCRGTRDVHFPK